MPARIKPNVRVKVALDPATREQLDRHPGYFVVTVQFTVGTSHLGQTVTLDNAKASLAQWIHVMLPAYLQNFRFPPRDVESPAIRVRRFLRERARMRGLDPDQIANLNSGVAGREATLTVTDLDALVNAFQEEDS